MRASLGAEHWHTSMNRLYFYGLVNHSEDKTDGTTPLAGLPDADPGALSPGPAAWFSGAQYLAG